VGEATDIVEKEMYSFAKGGEHLTLRPEGTAGAVRAYLESMANTEPLARWYYLGPMFRGERPAKGRYRQFYQVGAEAYGDPGPAIDAELIDLGYVFVRGLGIDKVEVRLNSLGSADARARYREALVGYFTPLQDKLSPDSRRRLGTNPLRILDSKDPQDLALRAGAPGITDFLSDDDRRHFDAVQAVLARLGVPFVVDTTVVRGLDYYTRTIFELVETSGVLGAQSTVLGGGRYDNLIAELGGRPTPAVGWAAGCERLIMLAPVPKRARAPSAMVIALTRGDEPAVAAEALAVARALRDAGIVTHLDTRFGKADRQFKLATRVGARAGVVLGSAEIAAGTLNLKDLFAQTQRTIPRERLLDEVRALLDAPPPAAGKGPG
jgi:histidyl-tRNA synthetase